MAPVLETVPQLVLLQPDPATDQSTDSFVLKQTVAVNDPCWPSEMVDADGDMDMAGEQDEVIVIETVADSVESTALVATSVTGLAGGSDAGAV